MYPYLCIIAGATVAASIGIMYTVSNGFSLPSSFVVTIVPPSITGSGFTAESISITAALTAKEIVSLSYSLIASVEFNVQVLLIMIPMQPILS